MTARTRKVRRPPDYGERLRRASELVDKGMTILQAATECGISTGRLSEFRRGLYVLPETWEEAAAQLEEECLSIIRKAYRRPSRNAVIKTKFPCRVIFLDDIHIPFTDFDVIREVVQRENGADILVTFEAINYDSFARFDQTYLSDADAEDSSTISLFEHLKSAFGRIVFGTSNHVERPLKALIRSLRPEQHEYFLSRVKTLAKAIQDAGVEHIDNQIIRIGNAIFCHYDRALISPGKTPERAWDRINAYCDVFGWGEGKIAAVFTGHNHRVVQTPMPGGKGYLYEVGCSCYIPPYALDHAKGGAWTSYRMAVGYGIAVFDSKGKIDLTESRSVHLGWARLPDRL